MGGSRTDNDAASLSWLKLSDPLEADLTIVAVGGINSQKKKKDDPAEEIATKFQIHSAARYPWGRSMLSIASASLMHATDSEIPQNWRLSTSRSIFVFCAQFASFFSGKMARLLATEPEPSTVATSTDSSSRKRGDRVAAAASASASTTVPRPFLHRPSHSVVEIDAPAEIVGGLLELLYHESKAYRPGFKMSMVSK